MSTRINIDSSELYQSIIDDLIEWGLTLKTGAGIYFKGEKYGHLKLTICGSSSRQDSILWTQVKGIIPDNYNTHIEAINLQLKQFADFVRKVRDEEIYLCYEIIDISYHPVDYRDIGYIYATNNAIMNCFEHPDFNFDSNKIWRS